jgi:hypothetical protein
MKALTLALAHFLVAAALLGAQAPADDEKLKQDLTAVIALHGQPCGEVVAVRVLGTEDYAASCKDGNNYRVYLNKDGRVVVEKQK